MLLPWMARSLIQTGYIAYPSTAFDLFTFDWKIPKNIVKVESQTIKYWARLPHQSMDRAQSLSLKAWVTEWYLNLSTNRRMIILGICILPFVYGLTAGFPKIRPILRRTLLPLLPAYIFVFAGILFWFYNAPDFRFGTTFLIPGLLILVIPGIQIIIEKLYILKRIIPVGVICLVIGYEMVTFATLIDIPSLQQHTLYPANYPQLPSYPDKIGETTIWIPDDAAENQCWYEPFPCIPKPNKSVELRGTQLQEGFRLK